MTDHLTEIVATLTNSHQQRATEWYALERAVLSKPRLHARMIAARCAVDEFLDALRLTSADPRFGDELRRLWDDFTDPLEPKRAVTRHDTAVGKSLDGTPPGTYNYVSPAANIGGNLIQAEEIYGLQFDPITGSSNHSIDASAGS